MDKQQYKELIAEYMKRESNLKQQVLDLTMENSELKDELKNYNCYAETDGYEVGSPSDYEQSPQLELFKSKEETYIYESPDGGKTIYRRAFNKYDEKELVDSNPNQLNLFND